MVTKERVTDPGDRPFSANDHQRAHPKEREYRAITASTTFGTQHKFLAITSTGSDITVTIRSNLIKQVAHFFYVIDEGGGAASNNITLATEGSETINGSGTYAINANREAVGVYSNGSNLFIFASYLE
jgi:hypothetical protein